MYSHCIQSGLGSLIGQVRRSCLPDRCKGALLAGHVHNSPLRRLLKQGQHGICDADHCEDICLVHIAEVVRGQLARFEKTPKHCSCDASIVHLDQNIEP